METNIIALIGIVPACLTSILTFLIQRKNFKDKLSEKLEEHSKNIQNKQEHHVTKLTGTPLAALDDYPVEIGEEGNLILNPKLFLSAIRHIEKTENFKAAHDLIYLGQSNGIAQLMDENEIELYSSFVNQFRMEELVNIDKYKDSQFETYKKIVSGIGETFSGFNVEVVLHDVRDPFHSVTEVMNTISGRHVGDPTTNFGVKLIKEYSKIKLPGRNYTNYCLTLKDGRKIKSSTMPIYDNEVGLIGFVCLNIDLEKFSSKESRPKINAMFDSFCKTTHYANINEVIDSSHYAKNIT